MATSYIKDEQGGTFIPASQRPDGTWRKPRRVRDGYVPQEEVPLYESLGKQFQKNKLSYPVGMSAEYVAAHKAKIQSEQLRMSTTIKTLIGNDIKKKKKKNKKKNVNLLIDNVDKMTISSDNDTNTMINKNNIACETVKSVKLSDDIESCKSTNDYIDNDNKSMLSDSTKRLKKLKKKIREIESLECKIKNGDLKNPEREVLDKISRKHEILNDIKSLESMESRVSVE